MKTFVLLGDSITQQGFDTNGWGQLLSYRKCIGWFVLFLILHLGYVRRADVFNRGYSGYNSRWVNVPLKSLIPQGNIDLATIFFGANDACSGEQHVPVEEYKVHIENIIQQLRSRKCERIIIITPPPVAEDMYLEAWRAKARSKGLPEDDVSLDRSNNLVVKYVDACVDIGKSQSIPVLNLFELIGTEKTQEYVSDGLHLNDAGNRQVFEELIRIIEVSFSEYHVAVDSITGNPANSGSSCSGILPSAPWWDRINKNDPIAENGDLKTK